MVYIVTYDTAREQNGELISYFEDIRQTPLSPTTKLIEQNWTVDLGDDPSFLAYLIYKKQGGQLSWGICRPDIRRNINPNIENTVVFIAHSSDNDRRHQYRLAAICSVEAVVSQWDIASQSNSVYNNYANLLLRFDTLSKKYIHREWYEEVTGNSMSRHHHNWIWRLGKIPKTKGEKQENLIAPVNQRFDPKVSKHHIRHVPFSLADIQSLVKFEPVETYILFSTKNSFIIDTPPVIATFHDNIKTGDIIRDAGGYEFWNSSSLTKTIYDHLFGSVMQSHVKGHFEQNSRLRRKPFNGKQLTKGGYIHRHHRFEFWNEVMWRNNFIDAISVYHTEIKKANWS
jgi:hypothetical protein